METICPHCNTLSQSPYVCLNCGQPLARPPAAVAAPLTDIDRAFAALSTEIDSDEKPRRPARPTRAPAAPRPPPVAAPLTDIDSAFAALSAEAGVDVEIRAPAAPKLRPRAPPPPVAAPLTDIDRAFAALSAEAGVDDGIGPPVRLPRGSSGAVSDNRKRYLIAVAGIVVVAIIAVALAWSTLPTGALFGEGSTRQIVVQDAQTLMLIERNALSQAHAPEADPEQIVRAQLLIFYELDDERRSDLRGLNAVDQPLIEPSDAVAAHIEALLEALKEGRDDNVKTETDASTSAMTTLQKAVNDLPPERSARSQ